MPRTKNLDLTQGIIWKQLLLFLLPIAAGTLFQQFYSTVDAIVVGRFLGSDALAAVGGSAAVIVQLVVGIFTGLSSGATVVISHGYGADDQEKLTRAVHTSIAFSLLGGIVITVVGILLTPQSLVWLKTPRRSWPTPRSTSAGTSSAPSPCSCLTWAPAFCGPWATPSGPCTISCSAAC